MAINLLSIEPSKISRDLSGYITYIYGAPKAGKAQPVDTIIPTPNGEKKIGELKVGDYVFDRKGRPTKILEIFPQGKLDCYKVIFEDGRETICNDEHLWTYYTSRGNLKTKTLRQMLDDGFLAADNRSKYGIPINCAVEYSHKNLSIDPYVIGCFLGDGCCRERQLMLSSSDEELLQEICSLIGAKEYKRVSEKNYSWRFLLPDKERGDNNHVDKTYFQTEEFFQDYLNELVRPTNEKTIPKDYLESSIEQRYALLQGLLDTDGSISSNDYVVRFTNTNFKLVKNVQKLVNSLGYRATINADDREEKYREGQCYNLSIYAPNEDKYKFFRLSRKKEIALKAASAHKKRNYSKLFIRDIQKLNYQQEMVCIYVDNDEHLYLTNDYIVTHNTTLATQIKGSLLLAFEIGYHALGGVYAQDIMSWSDVRAIVRELKKPEVKERFSNLIFDTVDVASALCEKYICAQNGVEKINEIAYGGGYALMRKEFEDVVRTMTQLGYSVFFISHDKDKVFKRKDGTEYNQTVPSCPNAFNEIAKNLADIYAYAEKYEENGISKVRLILRSTDNSIDCGCRFKYIDPIVDMSYQALEDAVNRAIDKEAAINNGKYVTNERAQMSIVKELDYDSLINEFNQLATTLMTKDREAYGPKITYVVNKYLGTNKKVSDSTPAQVELIDLINQEIKSTLL